MSVAGLSLAELRAAYLQDSDRVRPAAVEPPQPRPLSAAGVGVGGGAVGVLGVSGGVGATTVALALAEALPAARLFEFAAPHASGLAEAAIDELGERDGWRVGMRGDLELARRLEVDAEPVVDDGPAVLDLGAWRGDSPVHVVDRLVVVAGCSVPSIRRLDACLQTIGSASVVVPVITRAPRRLPRELLGVAGPALRAALVAGAVQVVPECRSLALSGLTSDRLPVSLQRSAAGLAVSLKELS